MSMLSYDFMQRAFVVSLFISVIIPCVGLVVVLKRLATTGEALSHVSLGGIAVGLVMGLNPILVAVVLSIAAALTIEYMRKSFPKFSDIATNVILSLGVGLAAVFSGLVTNTASFNNFLFGSIIAITDFEMYLVIGLSAVVIVVSLLLYNELFFIAFDEEGAKLSGIPVGSINAVFSVLTAVVVSVSARTVGALVVSSLIVIPIACAMMVSKSYKKTLVMSIVFAMLFTLLGLTIAFYTGAKPGGTIVLFGAAVLLAIIIVKRLIVHD